MKKISVFLSLLLLFSQLQATTLSGEGYGDTLQVAKREALASLASNVFVRIESSFESVFEQQAGSEGGLALSSYTRVSTDLPIIGAEFNCNEKNGYYCQATFNSERAMPLYLQNFETIKKEIIVVESSLKDNNQQHQYLRLTSLLQLHEQADKYRTLITFLTGKSIGEFHSSITRQQLKEQLLALEGSVKSLTVAADILARGVPRLPVYILPATLLDSREITPFASAMEMQLRKALPQVVDSYEKAEFSYSGSYLINKNGIQLSYSLVDRKGNTVIAAVVAISPEAYKNYRAEPLAPDFDRLLHNGYAIDNDFKVQLVTNKGSRQLLFHQSEEVKLMVKLNRPGYFFIVGHIKNDQQELSYLLDSGYGSDARKFVSYVNADQVNKWISLGEFKVIPPFGMESIQIFSAQKDLINKLPDYRYDDIIGYYVISNNINQGVSKTRGLKRANNNKTKKTKEKMVEAVLTFTTSK